MAKVEAYVFDLDGTLIDNSERFERCKAETTSKSEFWQCFLSCKYTNLDKPKQTMIWLAQDLYQQGFKIIIITGRPWTMEPCTLDQLEKFSIPATAIYYRPEKDYRKAAQFKIEVLKQLLEYYDVKGVYDDDEEVREAIQRELKIPAYPPFE